MKPTLNRTRLFLQNAMIVVTAIGFLVVWWMPFVAWLMAGLVSVCLLSEADHIHRVLQSPDQCLKLGLLLLGVILLIVLAFWRCSALLF